MRTLVMHAVEIGLLPDRIDVGSILTASGFGALAAMAVAATLRFEQERLNRIVTFGTLLGATISGVALLLLLVFHWEARCFATSS